MSTPKLSPHASFVKGALTAFLVPKMAADAKMPDLAPLLADVTGKNYAEMKPKILDGTKALFKDVKLAKDADLDDMHKFIDRLDKEQQAEGQDEEPDEEKKEERKAFDAEGLKEFLKDKMSEDNMRALDAFLAGDQPPEFAGSPVKNLNGQDEENKPVDQKAMDEAIKVAVDNATTKANQTQKEIREAERFVRPWVGELAMAHDSATAVHLAAAKILGIDGADKVHPDALPFLIKAQPLPGAKPKQDTHVAMDAATVDDFNQRYPMASRIGQL